jgi:hypothetical protein
MTRKELITRMKEAGYDTAIEHLDKITKPETTAIYVSDKDDQAYITGLADWLQNNTTWFNHRYRNGFTAHFTPER